MGCSLKFWSNDVIVRSYCVQSLSDLILSDMYISFHFMKKKTSAALGYIVLVVMGAKVVGETGAIYTPSLDALAIFTLAESLSAYVSPFSYDPLFQ